MFSAIGFQMISNKKDYLNYLEADRIALSKPKKESLTLISRVQYFFMKDYIWEFQKKLRKLEFLKNKNKNIFEWIQYIFVFVKYRKLSYKLGFTIPPNTFGPGLSIAHYGNIVVNPSSKIGKNCRIHSGVNIGTEAGFTNRSPIVGDNVYIGSGAKLFGLITIPNNTIIGANAVVNCSFEREFTSIGGIPSKIISENVKIDEVLIPATEIIALGINKLEISNLPARELKKIINERK